MDIFYDNKSITKYLEYMAYLNALSFSILSGCGVTKSMINKKSDFKDIFINVALYKKSIPRYENTPDDYFSFNAYLWKNKKVKKTISPLAQSLSIISLNLCARKIISGSLSVKNAEDISYYFAYAAVSQLNFMYDNLLKDNLLYSCKHKKNSFGTDEMIMDELSLNLLSQYYACEAAALTQNLIDNTKYYLKLSTNSKNAVRNFLPDLCHIAIKDALYTSSRNLSQICDSLINIYQYTDFSKPLVYKTMNVLGQELCERITSKGEILRIPYDSKVSSFFTLFMSLSVLCKLYMICGFPNYLSSAETLFKGIKNYWSEEEGFFIKSEDNVMEYSIKEIGALLSGLINFRQLAQGSIIYDLDRMISASFKNLILKSGIFINQNYPILDIETINLPKTVNTTKKSPPVFLKRIEYKKSKKKFKIKDGYYHAESCLWTCRQIL